MTVRNEVLENHSLMIRDGRILDILPQTQAGERYRATVVLKRPEHLVFPGMVNAQADAASLLWRGAFSQAAALERVAAGEFARDSTLSAIAEMLKSGITCFCDNDYFPEETACAAGEQGMRVVVGMPITEHATLWANDAAQSLTRALSLRDKYRGDPLVSTLFAPRDANALSDQTLARLITLADELDAGIMIALHQSAAEIGACVAAHGSRPIERLWNLGLLTPALNAIYMAQLSSADLRLAERTGISATLCPQSSLKSGNGLLPIAALAGTGMRLALGSAGRISQNHDVWGDMRLMALSAGTSLDPWDVLSIATHGGAAVLGLETEVGTLEAGKWADICCVDISGPAMQPVVDPLARLVFAGDRDMVSDAWVAGRQLLSGSELTRLEWPAVAARAADWARRLNTRG